MSNAELFSILINLAVGLYFAVFYPRTLQKRFGDRPAPRGFVMLQKVVPPVGWLIITLTLVYALTMLFEG